MAKSSRLQNHMALVHMGIMLKEISKEKNEKDSEKLFCPLCSREYDTLKETSSTSKGGPDQ